MMAFQLSAATSNLLKLAEALRSDAVQLLLVKDGDHRLSREQDIALLLRTVESLSGDV